MSFRRFIENAAVSGDLITIDSPVDTTYEVANVAHAFEGRPVLFTDIRDYPGWRICSGVCSDRRYFSMALDVPIAELMHHLAAALESPVTPPIIETAPCQEIIVEDVDLDRLPILLHLPQDAGHYVASNVVIINDPDLGRNMCYHRLLRLDKKRFAARIVENRGTYTALQKTDGDLPVAICIGVSLGVHLAASMSPPPGVDELSVANALSPTPLVKCITNDLCVPADAEIVLEGRITRQLVSEGPFMDLTETMDITRMQPVIEIDLMTHRRDPIYHALLPGGLEHKLLMGMPKEPTIYAEVNKVTRCTGAVITPGGTSWLHAVVQIDKQGPDDGRLAVEAAFRGHGSLKHVWVVDTDVDIYDPAQVEWAVATRFQADRDLYIYANQPGSSLDPSGTHVPGRKSLTAKMGLDCTIPWGGDHAKYKRGEYGRVDLSQYLPSERETTIMNIQPAPILNDEQRAMLAGEMGRARQMGMRLLLDLAAMAGAERLIPIGSAHLSGVSPLTGGLGLRLFLTRLAEDPGGGVAVPTTLNAAGCDEAQFPAMRIAEPDFLAHHREIIDSYTRLGVRPIQSCVPYEWDDVLTDHSADMPAAWAESNAICFANSYCGLRTNRESGLSALACAITGYAPDYGLIDDDARRPNLAVSVTTVLEDPTDFSILGDWIGKQRRPGWRMPYGPIPTISGLAEELTHEQRKALSAAAANYGCPLLYIREADSLPGGDYQDHLTFGPEELAGRYEELRPRTAISLVVLGCPQASIGELRAIAGLLRGRRVTADPAALGQLPPLWVFTSATSKAIAEKTGLADVIRSSGALLLENTCPEVVPYDQNWVSHILTNSMKAEHYIKSGLNGVPTSVMRLADCVAVAAGELMLEPTADHRPPTADGRGKTEAKSKEQGVLGSGRPQQSDFSATGRGLPSQSDFTVTGEALVTDTPITFLGYVNRETGVIEEEGHPANGQSLAGKIAIFPRGTGSSVAPYVLLELHYRGVGPVAIINTEIDQQTAPACSLEGIPYAYGFDADVTGLLETGDTVALERRGEEIRLRVIQRRRSDV